MVKILIVDDEPDVEPMFRQKFRNELKNGIIDLKFVLSAQNALEYMCSLNPFDIELVLTDINMPGINGFDFLKTLRILYPNLPVFMITAYGNHYNHENAVKHGANHYLTKPVDFLILKKLIRQIALKI